jgi:hypothetical protein
MTDVLTQFEIMGSESCSNGREIGDDMVIRRNTRGRGSRGRGGILETKDAAWGRKWSTAR